MKAFEITLNGKKTIVGAEDGLLTILINTLNANERKDSFIHSSTVEYDSNTKNTWHESLPINEGDVIKIKVVDAENITPPVKSIRDEKIKRPESKLERFYRLENLLKQEGLI